MKGRICVFTGSRTGAHREYERAARETGHLLVEHGYGLVYGGGSVGLMAVVAEAALERGGHVIGVIPAGFVEQEVAHRGLTELRIVKSMHERKAVMAELSDGFIGLPGGIGTMEEFFEVLSWAQLKLHDKPCGLLNVCGYYQSIIDFLDRAVEQDFLKAKHRSLLIVEAEPRKLLQRLEAFSGSHPAKGFDRSRT